MMPTYRWLALIVFSASAATWLGSAALAASQSSIMGRWCGTESSYAIAPKSMVVTRHSDNAQLVFEVVKIEPREQSVLIQWRLQGRLGGTEFGEFSADGLTMAQLANAKGPRREFRRC
jgi:hypothetical protein